MPSLAPIHSVLETSLYATDIAAAEAFYGDVLGLDVVFRIDGTHVSFACGTGVVHVFDPGASRTNDSVPPHGADGAVHVCFTVEDEALDAWAEHLEGEGIAIEDTATWPGGGRSVYVRDPAGNSVELATPTLWSDDPRGDRLRAVRPHVPVDTAGSNPVETFQHAALRPILKGLNETILALVASYLTKYGTGFAQMDRADQVRKLRNLLTQDARLKRTLVGMAMGHFTADEFAFYLDHRHELRRRMIDLLETRAVDQVDRLAAMVDKSSAEDA
jgi:catechol 2,3-dioxygenase-like lactoylglutathione lyase family enzyme